MVTLVVLMINKAMLSAGKDLTVDPRSISYPRNCVSAEDKIAGKIHSNNKSLVLLF